MLMAEIREFNAAKFFCGIIVAPGIDPREYELPLAERLGPVDIRSELLPFDFTDYYTTQMGSELCRIFLAFNRLRSPQELPEIKIFTNGLEKIVSGKHSGSRVVNIDPGYITEASMVLASAKPFSHRIPLANGIYGQLEYMFGREGVRFLPWTFPEYRSEKVVGFFTDLRRIYRSQLAGKM